MKNRADALRSIQGNSFDVCAIGGGATRSGCAPDAQLRGLRTVQLEARDFSSATSRASTNMVHPPQATHRAASESDCSVMLRRETAFSIGCRSHASTSRRSVGLASALAAALLLTPLFSAHAAPQAQAQTQQPAPPQASQQPPSVPGKIAVQVKAVTLYATVRDKHGKIVATLNKEDFSLEDAGNPQAITYFARESDLPLTLGPLVDTSLSQRRVIAAERDASYAFLDHMLRPDKDKAFLIHFDHEVELLQDLTSSREKLKSAMQELQAASPDYSSGGGRGGSRGDPDDGGQGGRGSYRAGTLLYDAVFLASDEVMKKQQGRKALIVLSDGVDHGSKESLEDAIEAAQRADTAVYSVFFEGEEGQDRGGYGHGGGWGRGGMGGPWPGGPGGGTGWPGGGGGGGRGRTPERERPDGKKILQRISTETGGRYFEVSKKLPIDQIYAQIEEELRNQYSLAFTPTPQDASGMFHKIRLTVKDKDLTVVTREGYYATH